MGRKLVYVLFYTLEKISLDFPKSFADISQIDGSIKGRIFLWSLNLLRYFEVPWELGLGFFAEGWQLSAMLLGGCFEFSIFLPFDKSFDKNVGRRSYLRIINKRVAAELVYDAEAYGGQM